MKTAPKHAGPCGVAEAARSALLALFLTILLLALLVLLAVLVLVLVLLVAVLLVLLVLVLLVLVLVLLVAILVLVLLVLVLVLLILFVLLVLILVHRLLLETRLGEWLPGFADLLAIPCFTGEKPRFRNPTSCACVHHDEPALAVTPDRKLRAANEDAPKLRDGESQGKEINRPT